MEIYKFKNIEYSIVMLSELEQNIRIGSEGYDPIKLRALDKLKTKAKNVKLSKHFSLVKNSISSKKIQKQSTCLVLDLESIGNFSINNIPTVKSNSISSNRFLSEKGDAVISRLRPYLKQVGTIYLDNVITTTELQILRAIEKKNKPYLQSYLYSLLCSEYAQQIFFFSQEGTNHPRFPKHILSNLPLPLPSDDFQKKIHSLIEISLSEKMNSEKLYKEAEEILLDELGLLNWKPKTVSFKYNGVNFEVVAAISKKQFKEVNNYSRFDAEFWEPQYEEVIKAFDKFPRKRIDSLISYPISSGATPKAGGDDYTDKETGYPFLRAVDLADGRVMTTDFLYLKSKIHSGLLKRTRLKNNDILFSIAGTVGRCAIFDHNFEANINQALCIIRLPDEKIVKRLYLVVLFNSYVGKNFIDRTSRQGLQTNLNLREVGSLEIPIICMKVQEKISSLLEKSFLSKDKSNRCLETAKTAVEIFIEEDEKAALKYLLKQK